MILRAADWIAPATIGAFLALQGGDGTVPAAWAVLTAGTLLAALGGTLDLRRRLSAVEAALGLALGAFAFSAVRGVDPHRSLVLSVPVVGAILLWLLIVRSQRPVAAARAVAAGLGLAAVAQVALVGAAAWHTRGGTPADWVRQAGAAWLVVPNDIGWIACVLPLWAAQAGRRHVTSAAAIGLTGFLAVCALLHSRTAALAACASIGMLVVASLPAPRRRVASAMLALLLVGGAAGLFALGGDSLHARGQLWSAAWRMFLDHPLTGVGLHDFVLDYRRYLPAAPLVDARVTAWPHDLFLEVAAECGLMGLAAGAFAVGCVARLRGSCHRSGRGDTSLASQAICSGMLGMGLLALVEASLLRQWVWLIGTSLCALAHIASADEGTRSDGQDTLE